MSVIPFDNMDEIIIEGLSQENFIILEKILKSYKVSIDSDISFDDVVDVYNKVKEIVVYLKE